MQPPNDSLKLRSWWQMPPQWLCNQNLRNIFIILLNERGCLLRFEELIPWNVLNSFWEEIVLSIWSLTWNTAKLKGRRLKCFEVPAHLPLRLQEAVSVTSPRSWPLISRHEMDGAICGRQTRNTKGDAVYHVTFVSRAGICDLLTY